MQDIVKASERPREKVISYNICVVTKSLVLHSFVGKGRKIQAHEILLFLREAVDLISYSPYCLPYNSCDFSWKNLALDQLIIPQLIFLFILLTFLLDNVLIL